MREYREMPTIAHFAKEELTRAGLFDELSDYRGEMGHLVMDLVDAFLRQGHSGSSAALALDCFIKLVRVEPLTPLTGDIDEWVPVDEDLQQNNRCSRVFKNRDGKAYDVRGKVFREPSGACFTSLASRTPVTFPYMPHSEIVDVPERLAPKENKQ